MLVSEPCDEREFDVPSIFWESWECCEGWWLVGVFVVDFCWVVCACLQAEDVGFYPSLCAREHRRLSDADGGWVFGVVGECCDCGIDARAWCECCGLEVCGWVAELPSSLVAFDDCCVEFVPPSENGGGVVDSAFREEPAECC